MRRERVGEQEDLGPLGGPARLRPATVRSGAERGSWKGVGRVAGPGRRGLRPGAPWAVSVWTCSLSPAPGNRFRLDQSDPSLSRSLFFLLLTALFPFPSSPFPSKDVSEGERLPVALRPANGKGFSYLPSPNPHGEFLLGDLRSCRRRSPKHFLCHYAPRVCWWHLVWLFAATSRQVLPALNLRTSGLNLLVIHK